MVAAVWSCAPAEAGRYPARYLFTFLQNHGALTVSGSPTWRTVVGGSRTYVDKLAKELSAVFTATPVRALRRLAGGGVQLVDDSDTAMHYDAAVVATHPDQALALLADPTPAEREILGAFRFSSNHTLLHTDASILPVAKGAKASWNYRMSSCREPAENVTVSYDMTLLQQLPTKTRYIVSLNARRSDRPAHGRRRDGVRTPDVQPGVLGCAAPPPGADDTELRPRRSLARLGFSRGRRPLGS